MKIKSLFIERLMAPLMALACTNAFGMTAWVADGPCPPPSEISLEIIEKFVRSKRGFTQGLELVGDCLLESTGAYQAETELNRVCFDGQVVTLNSSSQGAEVFGEGLTALGGRVFQATWKNYRVFEFEPGGKPRRTIEFPFFIWGLANDGSQLIVSDGTPTLRFLEAEHLTVTRELGVRLGIRPFFGLNELEWAQGRIFGNVLGKNWVVRIDPKTGCIDGLIDASAIRSQLPREEMEYLKSDPNFVLNGIAFDSTTDTFYLTGKNWKYIFKVKMLITSGN